MIILDDELRERVNALGWKVPKGVEMRVHVVPPGQLPGKRASITVITEKGTAPNLSFLQEPGFWINSNIPGTAAIQFALRTADGMRFLRLFDERDFDAIRRDWPDAPKAIFGVADPLRKPAISLSERIKRAEKHVNEQLSYGRIFPSTGPFGSTLEYRYQDGDLVDEIGQMRRLADALNSLADALEPEAE